MGLAREIEAVGRSASFSSRGDNFKTAPTGADGGGDGGRARVIIGPETETPVIVDTKQRRLPMAEGARMRLETPGGGGLGGASRRSDKALAEDLADGRLSREAAIEAFGAERVEQCEALLAILD
jgi:N-methylhydantoinase B